MDTAIARNVLECCGFKPGSLCILTDDAFAPLARCIARLHVPSQVRLLGPGAWALPPGAGALLLAEPSTFVQLRLQARLDFSTGEPRFPGRPSKVFILPAESLRRIFAQAEENAVLRDRLATLLRPDCTCRITTAAGTDLTFTARKWIPLDCEICTAPVERSVNGVIVVDGAVFFRRVSRPLTFIIRDGLLHDVTADTPEGLALAAEYRRMTAAAMSSPINRQLAEIGVGCCPGAIVNDCFMEAEAAADTCHFCFGSNIFYGGANASGFHGASVLIHRPVFTFSD